MARDYSIGEACDEFRCSRKTLNEWLEIEGINTNDLPRGEIDKRSRMIPRSVMLMLSKKHKRPLTSDLEQGSTPADAGDLLSGLLREVRLLRGEVEALETRETQRDAEVQHSIEGAVQSISDTFMEQLSLFPALQAQVQGFEQVRAQLRLDLERMVTDLITEQYQQALKRLQDELPTIVRAQLWGSLMETLKPQLHFPLTVVGSTQTSVSTAFPPAAASSSATTRLIVSSLATNKAKQEWPTSFLQITRTSDGLLVALGEFAELHAISSSTAKRARERRENPLPALRVKWPKGSGHIEWALDMAGQAKFYELYSIKPEFRRCELCPHTPDTYEHLEELQKHQQIER